MHSRYTYIHSRTVGRANMFKIRVLKGLEARAIYMDIVHLSLIQGLTSGYLLHRRR